MTNQDLRDAVGLALKAGRCLEEHDYTGAERFVNQALAIDPHCCPALNACGLLLLRAGRLRAFSARTPTEPTWRGLLSRALPRPLWRAALAMDTPHRIFFDELPGGATHFSARCRTQPTYELSLKLLRQWEASSSELRPGDHYGLVDGFAALLGLEGLYEVRECMPPSRQGPGEQAFPT
jgi:hypothetical protein